MTDNREGWSENEAGANAEKYSLAKNELIELGTQAREHQGNDKQKGERPNDQLESSLLISRVWPI